MGLRFHRLRPQAAPDSLQLLPSTQRRRPMAPPSTSTANRLHNSGQTSQQCLNSNTSPASRALQAHIASLARSRAVICPAMTRQNWQARATSRAQPMIAANCSCAGPWRSTPTLATPVRRKQIPTIKGHRLRKPRHNRQETLSKLTINDILSDRASAHEQRQCSGVQRRIQPFNARRPQKQPTSKAQVGPALFAQPQHRSQCSLSHLAAIPISLAARPSARRVPRGLPSQKATIVAHIAQALGISAPQPKHRKHTPQSCHRPSGFHMEQKMCRPPQQKLG